MLRLRTCLPPCSAGSGVSTRAPRPAWRSHPDERHVASPAAEALNEITSSVLAAAIRIHRTLGPGLLETAYLACLCCELNALGLRFELQKAIPLVYNGVRVDCAYRADLVVDGRVVVEVKAIDVVTPIHVRQLHTYVRLAACPVGLLLNFGAATMRAGIKRVVNNFPD